MKRTGTTKACANCNSVFYVPMWRAQRGAVKFCSVACWREAQSKPTPHVCDGCGKEFLAHEHKGQKFCSVDCKTTTGRAIEVRFCRICKTEFSCLPSARKQVCSRECAAIALKLKPRKAGIEQTCLRCGEKFEWKNQGSGKFCSRACVYARYENTRRSKDCKACGKQFDYKPYEELRRKYCSIKCAKQSPDRPRGATHPQFKPRVSLPCAACGKIVQMKPSKATRFRACSRSCRQVLVIQAMPRISSIERKMAAAFKAAGLAPSPQYHIKGFVVDFAFPDARLVVECDGDYWHGLAQQQKKDKCKDAALHKIGWQVLRLSETAINASATDCLRRVQESLLLTAGILSHPNAHLSGGRQNHVK